MRKAYASLFLLLVATLRITAPTTAQLRQGAVMLGATLGTAGYDYKEDELYVSVQPRVGYFVSDRIVVGAALGVDFSHYYYNSRPGEPRSVFLTSLQPLARIFFGKNRGNVQQLTPFLEAGGGVTYSRYVPAVPEPWATQRGYIGWTSFLSPGLLYTLSSSVALESAIRLSFAQPDSRDPLPGISFGIGVQIFFERGGQQSVSASEASH